MDQATEATTPTASTQPRQDAPAPAPARGSFEHATVVAAAVVGPLSLPPFSVHVDQDWPGGWRLEMTWRIDQAQGLYECATRLGIPVTEAETSTGIHLSVVTRVEDVEVHGAALVSADQAAALKGEPAPEQTPDPAAAVPPVPLGASVLAHVPVVTPVEPAPVEAPGAEDVARCARCGCTEDAACEGGCYWVANRQMVDLCSACATPEELQAAAYTPVTDTADGGQ